MFIADTSLAAMQYIATNVARGHHYYHAGIAKDRDHLDRLRGIFAAEYGINISKDQAYYRRKKGLATALFVASPIVERGLDRDRTPDEIEIGQQYRWVLLISDGDGPVGKLKKIDARTKDNKSRLAWGDYRLGRATRPRHDEKDETGKSVRRGGGLHWSWWLDAEREDHLHQFAKNLVKSTPEEVGAFLRQQTRRPMLYGVRNQVRRLIMSTFKLWSATHKDKLFPAPDLLTGSLPFVDGIKPGDHLEKIKARKAARAAAVKAAA